MKKLTITARVALLCTLITAAIAVLALGALFYGEARMLDDYYRDKLLAAVQLARDDIRWENGALDIDRDLDDMPDINPAVFTSDGDLIYGRSMIDEGFAEGIRRIEHDGGQWYVCDELIMSDSGRVWLRLFMSAGAAGNLSGAGRKLMLMILPALVALAWLGGRAVARRAMRPVAHITAAAESIAGGEDLKKRIVPAGARDEIYHLAEVFDGMLERLDGAFERERQFNSDVSHELRTPVAAILAQSGYALAETANDEDRREALAEIDKRAREMGELIRRLLALSRMDAGRTAPEFEETDMAIIAMTAAECFIDAAQKRGIQVHIDADCDVPVYGDQTMLTQAVMNLVENAVRYGRPGGNLWVSAASVNGGAQVRVRDDGPGMTAEQASRVFDRFYRVDNSRTTEGTGLGLALAKRIVQLHGGDILLDTAPDKGAAFTLVIPERSGEE